MSAKETKDYVGYKGRGGYPKASCFNCSFGRPEKNGFYCNLIEESVFKGGKCKRFHRDPQKEDYKEAPNPKEEK